MTTMAPSTALLMSKTNDNTAPMMRKTLRGLESRFLSLSEAALADFFAFLAFGSASDS